MRHTAIDNTADTIDSRDIIARIAELRELQDGVEDPEQWHKLYPEECDELAALEDVQDQATQYVTDWTHGATLIRDGYFTDYARELLEDCGDIPKELPWYVVVDWDATAKHIRTDYTGVDFDGVTYWVR